MKNKTRILVFLCLIMLLMIGGIKAETVKANELTDNVYEQLENLDLTQLEDYFNSFKYPINYDFATTISNLISGNYSFDVNDFCHYILSMIFDCVEKFLPPLILVFIIAILCGWMRNLKSNFMDNGLNNIIVYVFVLCAIGVLSGQIISIWESAKIIIENIANLCEIMSPIILTLMLASGATVSFGVYKPAIAIFSNGIINAILTFVFPIVAIILIMYFFNAISPNIKFNKFIDFFYSLIKWFFGIVTTIFGVYITVQGITSATFDGVSIKTAKYALSNSIPLIGGFVSGGLDLIIAGSVIIKNTIGIVGVFSLFFTILSPLLQIVIFLLLIKALSAIVEPITDERVSGFLLGISKCLSYINVCLIAVGMMFFVVLLLTIISANAFI